MEALTGYLLPFAMRASGEYDERQEAMAARRAVFSLLAQIQDIQIIFGDIVPSLNPCEAILPLSKADTETTSSYQRNGCQPKTIDPEGDDFEGGYYDKEDMETLDDLLSQ
jgi:hypothetical protein